jgi:transposase
MSAAQNNLQKTVSELEAALSSKDRVIAELAKRVELLEEYLRLERLRKYAARSEKSPDQTELFNQAELVDAAEAVLTEQEAAAASEPKESVRSRSAGRKPLPADLPRVRIEHDLSDEDKHCACGCTLTAIGEESSEQLDIIPAKIRVLVNVRKKYACKQCESTIKTATLPPQPIPKSNASPGLLAHIAVSKYQDALPLYRLEAILDRAGVQLPRNTLANWMIKSGNLIQPLINLLNDKLLSYPVMHCDETRVQVLNEDGKPVTSHSYMWVRVGGPPTQPIRLFHYADSRRGAVATELFEGYSGYLQTDDYAGYNVVSGGNIVQLGCWAHARRKFVEAQKASKKAGKADMAISLIGKLYAIERKIKDCDPNVRYEVRQSESVAQLQLLRAWLDRTLQGTLPKGLLGKALAYLDKNWSKLTVYVEDGRLSIDNNPAENAIRPFVVGRKNWLFSASVAGATASANLYSLIETAKANGLVPYDYLGHVFTELPRSQTVADIEALLPWGADLQGGVC